MRTSKPVVAKLMETTGDAGSGLPGNRGEYGQDKEQCGGACEQAPKLIRRWTAAERLRPRRQFRSASHGVQDAYVSEVAGRSHSIRNRRGLWGSSVRRG